MKKIISNLTLCIIILTACDKIEISEAPNTEPNIHTGWHSSMNGKIVCDGKSFYSKTMQKCIIIFDLNGKDIIPLPDNIMSINKGIELSPDGSQIAFASWSKGIFVMNLEDTTFEQLFPDSAVTGYEFVGATWSPNGNKLAFAQQSGSLAKTYVIDPYTLQIEFYRTVGIKVSSLDWSPDSPEILIELYTEYLHPSELKLLNPDNGFLNSFMDSAVYHPVWSHSGTMIAYSKLRSFKGNLIYMVDKEITESTKVADFYEKGFEVYCKDIAWSPDDKMIAIASSKGIFITDLMGNLITKLEVEECSNIDWQ